MGPFANQLLQGRKMIKTETSSRQINKKPKTSISFSGLEFKLHELGKEISAAHGSILPHTVLSTQQIGTISSQKPDSLQEVALIKSGFSQISTYLEMASPFNVLLKTEKYGNRILQVMRPDPVSQPLAEDPTNEEMLFC